MHGEFFTRCRRGDVKGHHRGMRADEHRAALETLESTAVRMTLSVNMKEGRREGGKDCRETAWSHTCYNPLELRKYRGKAPWSHW